jgi:hypothetical protein
LTLSQRERTSPVKKDRSTAPLARSGLRKVTLSQWTANVGHSFQIATLLKSLALIEEWFKDATFFTFVRNTLTSAQPCEGHQ